MLRPVQEEFHDPRSWKERLCSFYSTVFVTGQNADTSEKGTNSIAKVYLRGRRISKELSVRMSGFTPLVFLLVLLLSEDKKKLDLF